MANLAPIRCEPGRWYSVHVRFVKSVARGFSWTVLASGASQAASLFATIIAARLLGREVFGAFGAVQTTAVTLGNIAGAGLGVTATQYLARTCQADPKRAGRLAGLILLVTLTTAAVLSGGLAVFAPQLTASLRGGAELHGGLRLAAFYVLFSTLSGYETGCLLGLQAYRALTIASAVQATILPLAMYGLISGFGLSGAILALDVSAACAWLVQFLFLREEFRRKGIQVSYSGIAAERTVLWRFALPAACSGIIGNLAIWAGTLLLLRSPNGLTQYALFAAANSLRTLVLFAPAIVNKVAAPMFAHLHGVSQGGFRESFWSSVQLNATLAVSFSLALILFREPLLGLFGKSFGAPGLFALMLAVACLEVTAGALFQALLTNGAIWTHVGVNVLWSAVMILAAASLVNRVGSAGLAAGYCAAWSVSVAAYAGFAMRLAPRRPDLKEEHSMIGTECRSLEY